MPVTVSPVIDPSPVLKPGPRRSGGWFRRLVGRVKLAMAGGDDDTLLVMNATSISWKIFHDYHLLGIIDAGERRDFQLTKRGSLNVRPTGDEEVEYLLLPLTQHIHRVRIYRRSLSKEVEVYDLRPA